MRLVEQRGRRPSHREPVALTRPERELIDRAFTDHMRHERHEQDLLTPAEAETLEPLLTAWLARVEQPRPSGGEGCRTPGAP